MRSRKNPGQCRRGPRGSRKAPDSPRGSPKKADGRSAPSNERRVAQQGKAAPRVLEACHRPLPVSGGSVQDSSPEILSGLQREQGFSKKRAGARALKKTQYSNQLMKKTCYPPRCCNSSSPRCRKYGTKCRMPSIFSIYLDKYRRSYGQDTPSQTVPMIVHEERQGAGLFHATKKFMVTKAHKRNHRSKGEAQKGGKNRKILS